MFWKEKETMKLLSDTALRNGSKISREATLEGRSLKRLVAHYPDGDSLDIRNGTEGNVVLTLVPPFQSVVPRYPEAAPNLAPLYLIDERIDGDLRTVEFSPRSNLIQRFTYLRVVIPAAARLQVETGHEGNPFSVRLRVV
jgi:hypothetical protein